QADGGQSSRVPVPLPEDPYEAIRQAYLVGTDIESEPFGDLETETHESPHTVVSPTSLPDSTPPAYHAEEPEDSDTSGARSMSLYFTAPLSPDHPLTHTSPTLVPLLHKTASMAVHVSPAMSPSLSTSIAEVVAMSDSVFHKRFRSSYDSLPSPTLPVRKRYRGTSELILDTDSEEEEDEEVDESLDSDSESEDAEDEGHAIRDEGLAAGDEGLAVGNKGLGGDEAVPESRQRATLVVETAVGEPLGLGYEAFRRREIALREGQMPSVFEIGQGSGSVPEPEGPERVSAFRQPSLTTWIDPEDGRTYIDIPVYPPPAPPVQTPPSPEWSSGSLPISLAASAVPSPVSSPMISLTVPSSGYMGLFTRSKAVRDDIFSQRYRLRSLEHKQERIVVTFGALWRPVLALEAWAGCVDTQMADMSQAGYDDHRLVHDLLVEQAALQCELQEMRGRVTALEQERDRREQ
ncbi:hypothetical protein Tco_1018705, partial [Tanacetum coccineum]